MKLRPEEIASVLKSQIENYHAEVEVDEVGTVLEVGDGIARIYGLRNCLAMEMLELPHGVTGLALNLEEENVGAVLLGDDTLIKEGDLVKRTGRVLQVPVGEALIGRVVDPLGQPLDDKGPIETTAFRPVEFKAPGVVERQPVKEPLQTGIKAIDSHDPHRARPARAHHRRPPDRQDRDHRRHDHQPEGPGRDLRLRGHRPEGLDGDAGRAQARRVRRHGVLDRGRRHRVGLRRPSSSWRPTPAPPWASSSCTAAVTRCVSTTTSPSRPTPTGRCRCFCGARRAAKRSPATSSTCTRVCSSAPSSSTTIWAAAR